MRKVLVLSLAAAALLATTTASSAQTHALGRSGVHQADFATCSSGRLSCLRATNYRGGNTASCERAYRICMRTGTWDTYGLYGRRVTGVARQ
jgi:hypothetical protein